MDWIFGLPYAFNPTGLYRPRKGGFRGHQDPRWEMIRASISTYHAAASAAAQLYSILPSTRAHHPEPLRDSIVPRWKTFATRSRLHQHHLRPGRPRPTCYRLGCRSQIGPPAARSPAACSPASARTCHTDHGPLISIYRRALGLPGIRRSSRLGPAARLQRCSHDVEGTGAAPRGRVPQDRAEHTEAGPLSKMMKPGSRAAS